MPRTQTTPKKKLKDQEGEDFFLYNTEEDKYEAMQVLGLAVLDNQRHTSYDDNYSNELY